LQSPDSCVTFDVPCDFTGTRGLKMSSDPRGARSGNNLS
jgi:hypothetical protein